MCIFLLDIEFYKKKHTFLFVSSILEYNMEYGTSTMNGKSFLMHVYSVKTRLHNILNYL